METKKEIEEREKLITLLNKIEERILKMEGIFKELDENTLASFEADVKEWGGSAHIPVLKKYLGHKVEIRILKNPGEKLKEDDTNEEK